MAICHSLQGEGGIRKGIKVWQKMTKTRKSHKGQWAVVKEDVLGCWIWQPFQQYSLPLEDSQQFLTGITSFQPPPPVIITYATPSSAGNVLSAHGITQEFRSTVSLIYLICTRLNISARSYLMNTYSILVLFPPYLLVSVDVGCHNK